MAKPLKGDVVVVPFLFSDLTQSKRRHALVVARLEGDDLLLCQITSRQVRDRLRGRTGFYGSGGEFLNSQLADPVEHDVRVGREQSVRPNIARLSETAGLSLLEAVHGVEPCPWHSPSG